MLSRFSDLTFRRAPPPGPSHLDPLVSQAHADALVRAFVSWKYPRQIIVKGEYIVSVKVDDRGFIVHKWTKKIVDLKQVYLVVKDNRRIYQLALEFNQRPGEKKAFTDVLQFDPATSRNFTQLISSMRKELLGAARASGGGGGPSSSSSEPRRFTDKYAEEARSTQREPVRREDPYRPDAGAEAEVPRQGMNTFDQAIAAANARMMGGGAAAAAAAAPAAQRQPPPPAPDAFTPAAAPVADPFADAGAFIPAPAGLPHSPSPPSSGAGDPFNAMMQSVNQNGHQMETLFTPPPSVGYGGGAAARAGAVADPFAAAAAPAMPAAAPVADPFAAPPAAAGPGNPFAAAPPPQHAQANPFAAPAQPAQQHNPFA